MKRNKRAEFLGGIRGDKIKHLSQNIYYLINFFTKYKIKNSIEKKNYY